MRRDDLPISARLADLGYTHEKEKSVWIDGVHAIKESATGRVLREMDALEAACFCLGVEEAKADRDRLRSELDAIAKERSGPHCLRCRNAAACSTRGDDRSVPLCVTDPDGSMPLWDPVTLADVHAVASQLDAARAELERVRRSHLRRTIEACGELYRRALENSERNCPVYPTAERCITINRKVRQFREHQRATLSRMEAEG